MNSDQFVVLRRNPTISAACQRILGLPDDRWTDVQITFGTDEPAIARVGLLLSPEQVVELVQIAAFPPKPADE